MGREGEREVGERGGERKKEKGRGTPREREREKESSGGIFTLEFSKKHKLQGFPTRCCWEKNTKINIYWIHVISRT